VTRYHPISIWEIELGDPPHRYGHPGYGCEIWADDVGEDSIDTVILDIDMGYLVTLRRTRQNTLKTSQVTTLSHETRVGNPSCIIWAVSARPYRSDIGAVVRCGSLRLAARMWKRYG